MAASHQISDMLSRITQIHRKFSAISIWSYRRRRAVLPGNPNFRGGKVSVGENRTIKIKAINRLRGRDVLGDVLENGIQILLSKPTACRSSSTTLPRLLSLRNPKAKAFTR